MCVCVRERERERERRTAHETALSFKHGLFCSQAASFPSLPSPSRAGVQALHHDRLPLASAQRHAGRLREGVGLPEGDHPGRELRAHELAVDDLAAVASSFTLAVDLRVCCCCCWCCCCCSWRWGW